MGERDETINGRVTTSQFYRLQIDMLNKQDEMERRIMAKLEQLPAVCKQVDNNKDEIEKLRNKSNALDIFNGILAAVFATLAAFLGN